MVNKNILKTKKVKIENTEADEKNLINVLMKKAVGYSVTETQEEYSVVDNNLELTKRKVSTKYYPPDFSAISMLLEKLNLEETCIDNMSTEELETEKNRLLNLLKKYEE